MHLTTNWSNARTTTKENYTKYEQAYNMHDFFMVM